MKCIFCKGKGKIVLLDYACLNSIKKLKPKTKVIMSCPKCFGTGKEYICVLCGYYCGGYGNNPAPLKDKGECCDRCNAKKVIPARLKKFFVSRK